MPEMDGFQVAEKIRQTDLDVLIVFVTFLSEHMGKSFSVMASDYLIKPVEQTNLDAVLTRLLDIIKHNRRPNHTIKLKGGGTKSLPIPDIHYLESSKHYVEAVTADNTYEYYGKLSDEEILLAKEGFVRTHQSYLVNVAHIFLICDGHVSLDDGTKVPMSRKYAKRVQETYLYYKKRR
ncbi:hypothetical protein FACS1894208_10880 [Clostridia bacterium]|nr:hypothetical protein FACS1894208_10880 [Clostridia bacterium]